MSPRSIRHLLVDAIQANIKDVIHQMGGDPEALKNLERVSMINDLNDAPVILVQDLANVPEVAQDIIVNTPAPPPFEGNFIFEVRDLDHENDRIFYVCKVTHRVMRVKIMTYVAHDNSFTQKPREFVLKATDDWRWRIAKNDDENLDLMQEAGEDVNDIRDYKAKMQDKGLEGDSVRRILLSFLTTLNASNIEMTRNVAITTSKERINLARKKMKTRPQAFYTIEVAKQFRYEGEPVPDEEKQGSSKCTHLRRAHIRRFKTGKTTFVASSVVNAGKGKQSAQLWVI